MEKMKITYNGDIRTEAEHLRSGTKIITDGPVDNHGRGESFSPTDLMCTSLGACMLSIMGIVSKTHNLNIDGATADITKIMAAEPRRVAEIKVDLFLPGSYDEKEKKMLENAARNCPVAKSLNSDLMQTITFNYKD